MVHNVKNLNVLIRETVWQLHYIPHKIKRSMQNSLAHTAKNRKYHTYFVYPSSGRCVGSSLPPHGLPVFWLSAHVLNSLEKYTQKVCGYQDPSMGDADQCGEYANSFGHIGPDIFPMLPLERFPYVPEHTSPRATGEDAPHAHIDRVPRVPEAF